MATESNSLAAMLADEEYPARLKAAVTPYSRTFAETADGFARLGELFRAQSRSLADATGEARES